ncbi:MAG: DUF4105 domain-containing protein, partial [Prevotella sp.]|nr:DUF4105 domain-containing protein [Prevotella sp.]
KIISYFCIVKLFETILRLHFWLLLLVVGGGGNAFAQTSPRTSDDAKLTAEEAARVDSTISISLLTCQAGEESYSLYGHTAIRYVNREQGVDVAVNYGIFDMSQSNFVVRFIFGLTDYMMGIQPFDEFCQIYAYERRGIIEQELNLPPEEKLRVVKTIEENYKPENRNYRYNIFYNNCTTKARDVILGPMNVIYEREDNGWSFRQMLHLCTIGHFWTQFGNDLLLGLKADAPTTVSEQQFLPFNLKEDFDSALIGDSIPLVRETRTVVPMFYDSQEKSALTTIITVLLILFLGIVFYVLSWYFPSKFKFFWCFEALLMLVVGLCGLVLTAMIFSQHPTVNFNLQILILNPLALIGVYAAYKDRNGPKKHWFWRFYSLCFIAFIVAEILAYFIVGHIQFFAKGLAILAPYLFNITRKKDQSSNSQIVK